MAQRDNEPKPRAKPGRLQKTAFRVCERLGELLFEK